MRIAGEVLLAVVNSLWQAALVATLVCAALRFAKRMNAATRYAIWWAVLGVSLALPAAPQVVAWWHARAQTTVTVTANRQAAKRVETPLMEEPPAMVVLPEERLARWPLWVAGLWTALCAYRLGQIVRSYFYLRGVKKRAVLAPKEVAPQGLAGASRSTRLLLSKDVGSPMAVGFLHPAVILPEGLPEELAPAEMEHVLLHESAHIARRDDWSNLLAKTVGAGLALHPVAWWILRQIEREREIACDDWVVARVGAARPYAQSLARMSEWRWARQGKAGVGRGEALASGVFGGGSDLGQRIKLLLAMGRAFSPGVSGARVAASSGLLLGLVVAGALAPSMIAFAQEPKFEVASVKPSAPEERGIGMLAYPGGRLTVRNYTLRMLVHQAFALEDFQILGGPKWAGEERFSIMAQPPAGSASSKINPNNPKLPPPAEELLMLRALLVERFHLTVHEEVKDGLGYDLVVGSKGSKLTDAKDRNDFPVVAFYTTDNPERPVLRRGINASMPLLATALSETLNRPVLDRTGLKGAYDFKFDHKAGPDGWTCPHF